MEHRITSVVVAVLCLFQGVQANICCAQPQFTAHLFYDSGTVFIDAGNGPNSYYAYMNSSGHLAYDDVNKHTAYNLSGVLQSPLFPSIPMTIEIVIRDGTMYSVSNGQCTHRASTPQSLCVPDSAILKSSGYVGDKQANVSHYSYTIQGTQTPYQYDSIVEMPACVPLQASFFQPAGVVDSGTLSTVLIGDVEPGIKDPSVFNVPAACKNTTLQFHTESDTNRHSHLLKHFFH